VISNLTQLRLTAREIFDEALKAVDPCQAVRRAVQLSGSRLAICNCEIDFHDSRAVYSIAIGKAAMPMAIALEKVLGPRLAAGIISTNVRYGTPTRHGEERINGSQITNLPGTIFYAGHPQPNGQSLAAAQACFQMLQRADEELALIIFSISGGGSAMLEWPINEDISLSDLRAANRALVNCGASISEINAVRRAFSAVKGGRLAACVPHCDQITLIISDVASGEEYNVASGPTLAPLPAQLSAKEIVSRYDLPATLPESVLHAIDAEQPIRGARSHENSTLRKHFVLLDNNSALEAAAQAAHKRGFEIQIARDISDQSIESGCVQLLKRMEKAKTGTAIISGGEFSCPVRGNGLGGRNLETALRLAIGFDEPGPEKDFVALCAGTDGIDGNSPAAGAITDNTTIARARNIGLDPEAFLNRSDAYSFFVALGDAIMTGATGTNVRDLRVLLK
jgi:glycerate 2-kinase